MLSYNLLSVSKATELGKMAQFVESRCKIVNASTQKLVATATRVGSLYYLDCQPGSQQVNTAESSSNTKEHVWHRRYGHLGVQSLQKLAREKLVYCLDYNTSADVDFCEPCVEGKHHFPANNNTPSAEVLRLVHSDVCGKMGIQSLSGAEYFLTFIDDKTHYV